jgi:hypothetical protein
MSDKYIPLIRDNFFVNNRLFTIFVFGQSANFRINTYL